MPKVLLVDDEPDVCWTMAEFLKHKGYDALTASDFESALSIIESDELDAAVIDIIQCDFGSTRRASNNWFFLRWTVRLGGMESVRVSDVDGLYANQGDERLLMFQKGPYLMFFVGPSAAPLERLAGLANRFQI